MRGFRILLIFIRPARRASFNLIEFLIAEFYPPDFAEQFRKAERQRRRQDKQQKRDAESENPRVHARARLYRPEHAYKSARSHSAARSVALQTEKASGNGT